MKSASILRVSASNLEYVHLLCLGAHAQVRYTVVCVCVCVLCVDCYSCSRIQGSMNASYIEFP